MNTIDPFQLPSLPLAWNKALPKCPAIYFVIIEVKQIIYVGSTGNLNSRWSNHNLIEKLKKMDNICIAWFECNNVSLLPLIETQFIKTLKPLLNIRQASDRVKGDGSGNLSWGYANANSNKKKPVKQLYFEWEYGGLRGNTYVRSHLKQQVIEMNEAKIPVVKILELLKYNSKVNHVLKFI
jgi:GIY-YIG catalytic domain